MIEVESRDELVAAINDRTAMMFFLNASDPCGQVKREEFSRSARPTGIPTLLDAAADVPPVENLWKYNEMGFDLVGFSGGKGLRGPRSAGLLLGRKDLIEAAKLNNNPNSDSLCRSNKVNKEEVVGMLVALERYLQLDHEAVCRDWEARCRTIIDALAEFDDVTTEVYVPQIANAVPHLRIRWNYVASDLCPPQVVEQLRDGDPSIELAAGSGRRDITIGVWMMEPGDAEVVAARLREILAST